MARKPGPGAAAGRGPLTHFLCLPLVTSVSKPQLTASLKNFRDAVRHPSDGEQQAPRKSHDGSNLSPVMHPKAIRPVGSLHCTLGVMSLSPDQLKQAGSLLQSMDMNALLGKANDNEPDSERLAPFRIDLRGLLAMQAPNATSVLYTAPLDATERLYDFCKAVQETFKREGYLVPDDRPLKLHATVVNTIYVRGRGPAKNVQEVQALSKPAVTPGKRLITIAASDDESENVNDRISTRTNDPKGNRPFQRGSKSAVTKFDARPLLQQFADFEFAKDIILDRIAICEMGAKKITADNGEVVDEEYTEVFSVSLPRK